jgi:hypothetical protein
VIVKQIGGGGNETYVVFIELSEGYGADEQSKGRRHSYTAELRRRRDDSFVRSCGHEHRAQAPAERCGRRLWRERERTS